MIIDAHQHFWKFDPVRDSWMDPSTMQAIRHDFLPSDLAPILKKHDIDGTVAVQADQSEKETDFLIQLAEEHSFVFGVVGWIDLRSDNLEITLEKYRNQTRLVGFRHIMQSEEAGFMLDPAFIKGVQTLHRYHYTYDILVYAHQLDDVLSFIPHLEGQRLIIDHLAKPDIRHGEISKWRKQMKEIANYQNIYCKVSGLVTEAHWDRWQPEDLHPYMDAVFAYFGTDRCVFGSDWPVCTLAGSYEQVFQLLENHLSQLDAEAKKKVLGGNAIDFYDLNIQR